MQACATRLLSAVTFSLAAGLLPGCSSSGGDEETSTPNPTPTPVQTGTIEGRVFDTSSGNTIAGAVARSGTLQATTDDSGAFAITGVPVGERAIVEVSLAGYETAYQVVPVSSGANSFITVQALPVGATERVDPVVGGDVELPNSAGMVRFPAGSIAAGGPVSVTITDVAPATSAANMPGDYTNQDGESIESFGALSVNIWNDAGDRMDLAEGRNATVRIPISTRNSETPATIPLFYFDTASGRWVEDGTATLRTENGLSFYEGTVGHFTYWNADSAYQSIQLTGCVADSDGEPVSGVQVRSNGINYTGTSSAITDAQGRFTIRVRPSSQVTMTGALGNRVTSTRDVSTGTANQDISGSCLLFADGGTRAFSVRLSWGQSPRDLDSWLLRPEGGHISFTSKGSLATEPFASLDVDDTSSFGPEVVTVLRPRVGTYRYFVNNYSGDGTITDSPARVELTANGATQPFSPPAGESSSTFNWTVFDISIADDCTATVLPVAAPWTNGQPARPAPADETLPFCVSQD